MLRYLQDVATLEFDADACVGCGRCGEVCPHAVFEIADGKAAIIDRDLCMECGACARNCPVEAISVRAGVGCAQGILRGALGIGGDCCCGPDPEGATCGDASEPDTSSCCG